MQSGKSTITLSLFRLIELAGGRITIDGVDISKLSLSGLRSRMSIIPQDSQCFEGSLRENLDPEGIIDDEKLWQVLEAARLKAHVQTMVSETTLPHYIRLLTLKTNLCKM